MRILYHHRTLGDGAEGIHIAEMVNAFRQLGHEVLVIGPGVKNVKGVEKGTGKYRWVKRIARGPLYELAELAYNFFGYWNICEAIRVFRPDFIYDRYMIFNYSAIAVARKYDVPVLLEVNAPLAYERANELDETLYFKKIAYEIEKKVCSDASKTIVVSTPLKEYLVSIGIADEKVVVLPNGVNVDKFYPRSKRVSLMKKLGIIETDVVIGFVGILRHWHGIDILINAFREVCKKNSNSRLVLVGDGPIRVDLESEAEKLGVRNKMIITGRIPHETVGEYVSLFDVAVSPKSTFYASPMKIIEYMAQGKAVVAPDMANIRDIIENGKNGILFQPENVSALADALVKLSVNKLLNEQLGVQALTTVKIKFNWIANAKRVLDEFALVKLG